MSELKDRSAWLVVFGSMELLIGACLLLLVPLTLAGFVLSRSGAVPGPAPGLPVVLSSLGMYLLAATFFLWMGVGTILQRRWARALMLCVSWLWLATGILGMVLWLVMLPEFDGTPAMPESLELTPGVLALVKGILSFLLAMLYVVLPAVFVLFLRSPSVVATVERVDRKARWTDRRPGAVLSMSLSLVYGAVACLFALPFNAAPFFGLLFRGLPAVLVWMASAALLGVLAWAFYELRPAAWWGTLALTGLWVTSSVLTLARVDPMELYRAAGLTEEQLDAFEMMGMGSRSYLLWVTVVSGVAVVVYLLYLRRLFRPGARAHGA